MPRRHKKFTFKTADVNFLKPKRARKRKTASDFFANQRTAAANLVRSNLARGRDVARFQQQRSEMLRARARMPRYAAARIQALARGVNARHLGSRALEGRNGMPSRAFLQSFINKY